MADYLFSYDFRGDRYSFTIDAETDIEAKARLMAMSRADYDGVVQMEIGPLPAWLARLLKPILGARGGP